jgi:hypothetical protein
MAKEESEANAEGEKQTPNAERPTPNLEFSIVSERLF